MHKNESKMSITEVRLVDIFSLWLLKISNLNLFNPEMADKGCEQVGTQPDLNFISFSLSQLFSLLMLWGQ